MTVTNVFCLWCPRLLGVHLLALLSVWIDLTALAQALDSEQAHTSFGKLPMSVEKTQAQYSFPQANRWDGCKIFVNELTKNENIGKNAPGPQYMYND